MPSFIVPLLPLPFNFTLCFIGNGKAEAVPPLFWTNQMNPVLSKSLHNSFGLNEQGNVDLCRAVAEGTLARIQDEGSVNSFGNHEGRILGKLWLKSCRLYDGGASLRSYNLSRLTVNKATWSFQLSSFRMDQKCDWLLNVNSIDCDWIKK